MIKERIKTIPLSLCKLNIEGKNPMTSPLKVKPAWRDALMWKGLLKAKIVCLLCLHMENYK